ncbi:cell division protein FtsQ/DivIB [Antarcticimicrobium sediminis]|uniref:Cell division protein FtsQ n=1 Tax=Antarcticimicrobium sediminis TaxID=2546227 RepID=A0A4R5F1M6_9RHOB|nr:cell division protein FtsQ/DivIB [Antarcticimicrobium sediminis]TDE41070.1 FtsQ-type POTRA domain-containing protein [Antarcticimicrobium sediminis]
MQQVGQAPRRIQNRADPAPSRLNYRVQRWMLTPGIRLGLRIGIPFCLCFALGSAFMADPQRRDALNLFLSDLRASIQERPEFMVGLMAIDGAGGNLSEDIREAVALDFPVSSFDLDLEQIRQRVIELDPVAAASVRIRPGGILQVDVSERQPSVIWRSRAGLSMLDEAGAHVDNIAARLSRPDLPLVAGQGADLAVPEALALIAAAGPLADRLRGLVRVGERRWDVVLDRGQRILLPPDKPVRALERVLALSEVRDLLDRDVTVVDMRLRARPTVRMSETAVEDWWKIRKINGYGQ